MPKIFISYRRDDSADASGRLYDYLEKHFGKDDVFIDVDHMPFGVDFRKHLSEAVGECDVLLAVIGENWLTTVQPDGRRRLDDPRDFVRIEIEAALARGIPLIPVLVGRAQMPSDQELPVSLQELAFRNAAELRSGRDFRNHVERLIRGLKQLPKPDPNVVPTNQPKPPSASKPTQQPSTPPRPPENSVPSSAPKTASTVVITCPSCSKKFEASGACVGKKLRCPHCQETFVHKRQADTTPCPVCTNPIEPDSVICAICGLSLRGETTSDIKPGVEPIQCANPACGAENSAKSSVCQQCRSPLPRRSGTLLHNRYRIDKLLGMGGFSAAYLTTDTSANRVCVVKEMLCVDPQEFTIRLSFFRREAEILQLLRDIPTAIHLYELIESAQTVFQVVEYLEGRDLLTVLEEQLDHPFPLDQVIEWGISVCSVLHAMHHLDPPWVHRDIKPDTLLLMDDGRLKLMDFGTSRDIGRTAKERMAGKTRIYTEGYSAPEQILGRPEERSDLFSLAATLYQLATGICPRRHPHGGSTRGAIKVPRAFSDRGSLVLRTPPDQPQRRSARTLFHSSRVPVCLRTAKSFKGSQMSKLQRGEPTAGTLLQELCRSVDTQDCPLSPL